MNVPSDKREARRALGLCFYCSHKAIPGTVYCQKHKDRLHTMRRQRHLERNAKGLCALCDQPVEQGKRFCSYHLAKVALEFRRYYAAHREQRIANNRAWRKAMTKQGRCINCGVVLKDDYRAGIYCTNCRKGTTRQRSRE